MIFFFQAVVTQPTPVTRVQISHGEMPNNYLTASIINLLCCFFLLGIIALIFSLQVSKINGLYYYCMHGKIFAWHHACARACKYSTNYSADGTAASKNQNHK